MATVFSKIIAGEIPCYKIYEDDKFLAFLDVNPVASGHTLLIPKIEVDYIFDLPNDLLAEMLVVAKPIANAIQAAVPCQKIGLSVVGLEVPHAHLHLIPINNIGDMSFTKERVKLTQEDFKSLALSIVEHLDK